MSLIEENQKENQRYEAGQSLQPSSRRESLRDMLKGRIKHHRTEMDRAEAALKLLDEIPRVEELLDLLRNF